MARSDWYGGLRWVTPQDTCTPEVAIRCALEAGEAQDRMRDLPRAPPTPLAATNDFTSDEYAFWLALLRRLSPDDAAQTALRSRAAAAEIADRRP
jgi:hypothetical protein